MTQGVLPPRPSSGHLRAFLMMSAGHSD